MELKLIGASKKNIKLADKIFACDFNEPLIHQVVNAYLAAGRAGTQAQKTRAEVRGGGIKPWRQKGTGRARAGTIRSPLWRKGGVVFAAKPRSYAQKVNKKMYRGAMCSIYSELVRSGRLVAIESLELKTHKTKEFIKQLADLNIEGPVLIITDKVEKNLYLASRNLHTVQLIDTTGINPVALVKAKKVLITVAALKQLEESLT